MEILETLLENKLVLIALTMCVILLLWRGIKWILKSVFFAILVALILWIFYFHS